MIKIILRKVFKIIKPNLQLEIELSFSKNKAIL